MAFKNLFYLAAMFTFTAVIPALLLGQFQPRQESPGK
jgi:hypothetical protein